LFGPISINWAAKPLRTIETVLACIRGITAKTGLQVSVFLIEKMTHAVSKQPMKLWKIYT